MNKVLFLLLLIFLSFSVSAISIPTENWSLVLYGGTYTQTDLLPIVLRQKTEYKNSYIGVIGFSRPLDYRIRFIEFEAEGNVVKHFGSMNHWETNLFYIAKISNLGGTPFAISIGEGLSLASENPKLENTEKEIRWNGYQSKAMESRNLLNFLMVEMSYRLPMERKTDIFLRVHHRSGIFGLYCPPDPNCGSNFISYGFRTSL
ncbi:hypothetical protein [Leptospira idonii]|uniref:DUF3575 domain-containing protein n=1 Tax=Leptospira idonii TaxID=1193500 RepID=A0A4R9LYM9_9LEPT|nr:hypothetical protein [Leptospira idonii]TGN17080.1 hypothetical protein EHS15_18025 [Leptospira idonii]